MKRIYILGLFLLCLTSCESLRTYMDSDPNDQVVVNEDK